MWGAPNGHIIDLSGSGLIDIDPLANGGAGSVRVINASVFGDGVSVSPDSLTAYVETGGGTITLYNIASGLPGTIYTGFNSPDGTGVISGGTFNDYFVVNNNNGDVDLQNPLTPGTFTMIATGATRGDYTSPDPATCTLFLDESNSVMRLGLPGACIGGSAVPEPASIAILTIGLAGLAGFAGLGNIRRRRFA